MSTFALTFGLKYRDEPHPVAPKLVHPDGYVTVIAPTEAEARDIVCSHFGLAWAFLYPEGRMSAKNYPLGELAVLTGPSRCRLCNDTLAFVLGHNNIDGRWVHRNTGRMHCATTMFSAVPDSSNLTRPGSTEQDSQ